MSWSIREDLELLGIPVPQSFSPDDWLAKLRGQPAANSFAIVFASAVLFYRAEKGHNPKVNDFYDALIYCSTCLSVGYADVFARTPTGKLIGTFLMTIGPSLAAKTLDGRETAAAPTTLDPQIGDKLDGILRELQKISSLQAQPATHLPDA